MDIKKNQQVGSLNISQSVIEQAVVLALREVDGVSRLVDAPKTATQILRGAKASPIGLKVVGDVANIDVYVVMKPEHRIQKAAKAIQNNIKEMVQNMTGIAVSRVNIHVRGIENNQI